MQRPRGTKIGILENTKKIIGQLEQEDTNPKQVKPLSSAEQKEFLSMLNLNVPKDERKLYK